MAKFTNTPLDVSVELAGVAIGTQVFVASVSVTSVVNDFPTAQIALGYKTPAGKKSLETIFPREGSEGKYYSKVTIKVSGDGGGSGAKMTTLPGEVSLFSGYVTGFSTVKSGSTILYELSAVGGLFLLSQISVATPGIHSGSGAAWGSFALQSGLTGEKETTTGLSLTGDDLITDMKESFVTSKNILVGLRSFASKVMAAHAGGADFGSDVMTGISKAYGQGGVTASIVNSQLSSATIKDIGIESPLFFSPADIADNDKAAKAASEDVTDYLVTSIAYAIFGEFNAHPKVTWWDFLITTFDTFGLDIFFVGDQGYVIPKSVLSSPSKGSSINIFLASDIVSENMTDAPLASPTRVIVVCEGQADVRVKDRGNSSADAQEVEGIAIASFPTGSEENDYLTSQEVATGVKAMIVSTPSWFRELDVFLSNKKAPDFKKILGRSSLHQDFGGRATPPSSELDTADDGVEAVKVALAKMFAKYVFFKERFKQRRGSLECRLKLEAIAGLPARIIDPADIGTFDCWLESVTHTMDYTAGTALTSCVYSYGRYGGELKPNPLVNPQYPTFDISEVESAVREKVSAAANFFDRLRKDT